MPSTTARPWVCTCCGAVTTEAGRRLMGPLCWLCGGTLEQDEESAPRPWPPVHSESGAES